MLADVRVVVELLVLAIKHFGDAVRELLVRSLLVATNRVAVQPQRWRALALDDADTRRARLPGVVLGSCACFVAADRLRDSDHRRNVRLARIGRTPPAAAKVIELAQKILDG